MDRSLIENKICETIKTLRRERAISQEVLADALGISVLAVSKWETGGSLPDILTLPAIARYFGVTTDTLYYGIDAPQSEAASNTDNTSNENHSADFTLIPDDGTLRVVTFLGSKLLSRETYDRDKIIKLKLDNAMLANGNTLNIEIWGGAEINGDIVGCVSAGDSVSCGDVAGNVSAGDAINCGDVAGNVSAGDGVECGDIAGNVSAGDGVGCGDVTGNVSAGDSVSCGDIDGNVSAGDGVSCGDIDGDIIISGGNVTVNAGEISGDVINKGSGNVMVN